MRRRDSRAASTFARPDDTRATADRSAFARRDGTRGTVIAVVFAVSSSLTYALTYQPPQWSRTLVASLSEWYTWAALTPAVAWVATRFRFERRRWIRRLVIVAAIGIPVAIVKVVLTRVLRSTAGVADSVVIANLATHYLIYWGIIGAVHGLHNYQAGRARELQASQLEASLAAARLQLLTMQLQPHFLFNTLNAIAELVHESPAAAERMIGGLSRLLRETLDTALDDVVPLAQELDLLERYLEIQRVRFGDRLDVRVLVDPEVRTALVPALLLQPLVENSIKHGLAVRAHAGRIDIRAECVAGWLMLEVQDDGEGFGVAAVREGVGLGNTKARLAVLYKDAHTFDVARAPSGGAIVRIGIPWSDGPTGVADLSRRSSRPIQRSEGG